MRILLIAQLKRLRRHPVPPEALSRGRVLVETRVAEFPMRRTAAAPAFAWAPVMAVLVITVVLSPGALAFAAKGALPGDRLYPLKIAVEEVRVAVTPSQEGRYRLRSAQAERRLAEAELVIEQGKLEEQERLDRIEKAMGGYEKRLFDLNVLVLKADPEDGKSLPGAKARTLDHLLERHERLVEVASATGLPVAPIVRPVKDALELRSNVRELIETRKAAWAKGDAKPVTKKGKPRENDADEAEIDRRLDERAGRLRERLESFEREREDRRERREEDPPEEEERRRDDAREGSLDKQGLDLKVEVGAGAALESALR